MRLRDIALVGLEDKSAAVGRLSLSGVAGKSFPNDGSRVADLIAPIWIRL